MYFFGGKKMILFLLVIWMAKVNNAIGQPQQPPTVRVSYDTAAIPALFTTIPVGFTFVSSNGKSVSTRGWLRGRLGWKNLHVSTKQGVIHDGQLTYDRQKVWDNKHQVTFEVKMDDSTFVVSLSLPFVKNIRFNLYTDSLKRDNPFYLNVEGEFSNGRIYPLDTSMVVFRKLKGGGTLDGNVITVTKKDTDTHFVTVETRLKTDSGLIDRVKIPVKILPDPSTLPSEQELLNKWEKRKRH